MSSVISGRKSIGNRSNRSIKSGSSRRGLNVSSRFWKPTISSSLKKRELGILKKIEENENLTEKVENKSATSKRKSPAPNKFLPKSPMKLKLRLSNKFPSPAIKLKTLRANKRK